MKKRSKIKDQRSKIIDRAGQTMLEILVALTLIILFLSGIVVVELFAVKNIQYAQKKSIATSLSRQQLERARVVRDTEGIGALESLCARDDGCFIDSQLNITAISPTGVFGQNLRLVAPASGECPTPAVNPTIYKSVAYVTWERGTPAITPAPELSLSSCLSDWR